MWKDSKGNLAPYKGIVLCLKRVFMIKFEDIAYLKGVLSKLW